MMPRSTGRYAGRLNRLLLALLVAALAPMVSAEEQGSGVTASSEFAVELDPYYTNVGLYLPLTAQAIPDIGAASELDIYRTLLLDSLKPRFMLLEASVNPLPLTGVYLRRHQSDLYDNSLIGGVNMIEAATAGFEEPAALSLFIGNVVNYHSSDAVEGRSNKGHMGYLVSGGSKHIKANRFIDDNWLELEWKLKSDQAYRAHRLSMSYRVGTKLHSNSDITDVVYLGLRRNHLDKQQDSRLLDFINNGDLEYTLTLENGSYDLVQQEFRFGKKWPLYHWAEAFTLDIGLIWYTSRKYSGVLSDDQERTFTFMLRPNIEF